MDQFRNKIQSYHNERTQKRDNFKNQYLKLNRFEENSIKSQKLMKAKNNIESDYLMLLDHQVSMK